jgi:DnaJ-class molecular chaperone
VLPHLLAPQRLPHLLRAAACGWRHPLTHLTHTTLATPHRAKDSEESKDFEVRFKDIAEANEILCTEEKRAAYDRGDDIEDMMRQEQQRQAHQHGGFPGGGFFHQGGHPGGFHGHHHQQQQQHFEFRWG